ncbi:hypothetical protein BT63DRAFT_417641 [Microthyrium microscopicum]|uniref:F-box domain-containing protein n=1 Tax=Microthyrium microscopicum TaxID=703497 RepID=A0A6A6U1G1_9PEZI|nr:hypothetical protein BT63DRAFT_417641 [Microthyrium microscopicum]
MVAPPRPATRILPAEIWYDILDELDDLPHLWRKCRQVCHAFKEITESIFARQILEEGDMNVSFDLGWGYVGPGMTEKRVFGASLFFKEWADEKKEVAVFQDENQDETIEDDEFAEVDNRMMRSRWSEKVDWYTPADATGAKAMDSRFDLPPWTISIGSLLDRERVNDTELPGWKIDYAKKEMRFRWKEALDAFYREVEYIDNAVKAAALEEHSSGRMEATVTAMTEGKISMAAGWLAGRRVTENARLQARKEIRRHRIRRFQKQNYKLDPEKDTYELESFIDTKEFCEEEKAALKRMQEMEWMGSAEGLISLLPSLEVDDPLNDPMAEDLIAQYLDMMRPSMMESIIMNSALSDDDVYDEDDDIDFE